MKISTLLMIAICSTFTFLLMSCNKDAEIINNQEQLTLKSNQTKMYVADHGYEYNDCECTGMNDCIPQDDMDGPLPDYFENIELAIDYVESTDPSLVVFGYSRTKSDKIKLDLSYAGSKYNANTCGAFKIYTEDVLIFRLAEALGSRSITLLPGEYKYHEGDGSSFSGHVIVDAKIK